MNPRIRRIQHAALIATIAMTTTAYAGHPYENDMRDFEIADRANPPPSNAVLFVGSSTVRLWPDVQRDFPDVPLFNRGFGGATIPDILHYMDRIVIPYRPSTIIFYGGDNDLAAGRTPEQVIADFQRFVARARETMPAVRIVFVSIKPSPQRWKLADRMKSANAGIRSMAKEDPLLEYVDTFTPMLGPDGQPRHDLYDADGLHMGKAGYALWREILRPHVR